MRTILSAGVLATLLAGTAAGATWVVDDDDGGAGVDYTSIQAAVDAASAGDTIEVRSGTYYENVDVGKRLTLTGDGADVVTVQAASSNDHVFDVTADRVNITGFKVTEATGDGKAGIYVGSGIVHSNISNSAASNNYYGIYLDRSSNNLLTENTPSKNSMHGIRLAYSSGNVLRNNIVSSDNGCAILLYASADNRLINNDVSNSFQGIYMYTSSNDNLVSGNTASNNQQGGIYLEGNNNTITGNTASNNDDFGIALESSSNNTLYHNNLDGNTNNNAYDDGANQWDSGSEGNYYSDYTGTDSDGDGIGDTPYPIPGGSSVDRYPLMAPWTAAPLSGKIAFASFRDGNQEVYVMNANGTGDPIDLTNRPDADDGDPTWSPDGKQIAFSSNRSGNWTTYVMNADGSDQVCLLEGVHNAWGPAWSPDGTKIAVACKIKSSDDFEIYTVDIQSKALTQVTDNTYTDSHSAWSPDSHKIVFTSTRDGNQEIYVADLLTGTQTRLTDEPSNDDYPEWSPDGSTIAFVSERDGNPEIYSMNIASKAITRLTHSDSIDKHAQWSPDGQNIVFISDRDGGDMDVYVMKADGTGITRLVDWEGEETHPTWSSGHSSPPAYAVGEGAPDPATENHFIDAYNRNGGLTVLGSPTTEVHEAWGYLVQDFPGTSEYAGGIILYNPDENSAYYIHGAIWEKYYNYPNKADLGPVASDEMEAGVSPQGTIGRYSEFEYGRIHWISDAENINSGHPQRGESFVTYGDLDAYYTSLWGTNHWLGFPVMDQEERDGHGYCEFEGGSIEWDGNAYQPYRGTISVTSPNGGEDWQASTIQTIQWTYTGDPGPEVEIEILKDGWVDWRFIVPTGTGGHGSYEWKIEATQTPGNDYQVRITSTIDSTYTDISEHFTISEPTTLLSVEITSPNKEDQIIEDEEALW